MKKIYALILVCILLICLFDNKYIDIKLVDLDGVSFNGYDITISGSYVFYKKFRKFGADLEAKNLKTGEIIKIARRHASNVHIDNNMIYFSAPWGFGVNERIFKRDIRGLREKKLNNVNIDELQVKNNQLFYRKVAHQGSKEYADNGNIYKIDLKKNDTEKVLPYNVSFMVLGDDYLYFSLDKSEFYDDKTLSVGIYRYSIKDKTTEIIVNDAIHRFYINNSNLIYSKVVESENEEEVYDLLKLNLDTNDSEIIANKILAYTLCEDIVCYIHKDNLEIVNVMNIASGKLQKIKVERLNYHKDFVFCYDILFYYDMNNGFC